MSTNSIPMSGAAFTEIIVDTQSDATSENDVAAGSAVIFIVDIDNRNNSDSSFTKIWNNAAPTVGTTDPDAIIRTTGQVRRAVLYGFSGTTFGTAVSFATLTAGGTAGSTSPSNSVTVKIGLT